jgi:hypothetical protein
VLPFCACAKEENGSTSEASPSRLPIEMVRRATMTVSEPAAAWASAGSYSIPSDSGCSSVTWAKEAVSSCSSRVSSCPVMVVSIAVMGRSGCCAAPEPPSMWSTLAIAMSSG